jgi:hypothetical protein
MSIRRTTRAERSEATFRSKSISAKWDDKARLRSGLVRFHGRSLLGHRLATRATKCAVAENQSWTSAVGLSGAGLCGATLRYRSSPIPSPWAGMQLAGGAGGRPLQEATVHSAGRPEALGLGGELILRNEFKAEAGARAPLVPRRHAVVRARWRPGCCSFRRGHRVVAPGTACTDAKTVVRFLARGPCGDQGGLR